MIVQASDTTHLTIRIDSEFEMDLIGRALAEVVQPGVVIGLVGTLGAGKTRLVRALAEALGVDPGVISSPTYVLIQEYPGRIPIYHFDAYRLADPESFEALGAADHWSEGEGLCLIEWADLVVDQLPASAWWVTIDLDGLTGRVVQINSSETDRMVELLTKHKSSTG